MLFSVGNSKRGGIVLVAFWLGYLAFVVLLCYSICASYPYVKKCFEEKNTRIGSNSNPSLLNVIVPRWVVAIVSVIAAILMGVFEHAVLAKMTSPNPKIGLPSLICLVLLVVLIATRAILLENCSSQYSAAAIFI